MVILQAVTHLNPLGQQWLSPPPPPPSDLVLPLCLTPQEEGVVIQDYSAVSVSEQLWVSPVGSRAPNPKPISFVLGAALANRSFVCGVCVFCGALACA